MKNKTLANWLIAAFAVPISMGVLGFQDDGVNVLVGIFMIVVATFAIIRLYKTEDKQK